MANTLKQQMAADAATTGGVFFNTSEFARNDVILRRANKPARDVAITCVFDPSREYGTNEILGDGAAIKEHREGERERKTAFLEVPVSLVVKSGDFFIIDGEKWGYIRQDGSDQFVKTLRIVRVEPRLTRQPELRKTNRSY